MVKKITNRWEGLTHHGGKVIVKLHKGVLKYYKRGGGKEMSAGCLILLPRGRRAASFFLKSLIPEYIHEPRDFW